jgi:proteasome lid subunit RPN8/RPN11
MGASDRSSNADIKVRPAGASPKPVRRVFPGPRGAASPLRVAIDRAAYADLIAHAKESLEAEVCGVLAGQICEDDEGVFVHVEALIRGNAATQAATHVTFTQATWDAIHQTLERDHPKRRIVGWYHTHPGFGVEFSEMDLFIQRNFFPDATQIALVTDPMNGAVAIAINRAAGVEYLPRFWVDGREQTAQAPGPANVTRGAAGAAAAPAGDLAQNVKALESRVAQLIQAHDDQRTLFQRFVFVVGFVLCAGIATVVGFLVAGQFNARLEPPQLNSFVPVPVQIGDKTVLLGVGIAHWEVPPELNATLLQLEILKQEHLRKREAAITRETTPASPPKTAPAGESAQPPPPPKTETPP